LATTLSSSSALIRRVVTGNTLAMPVLAAYTSILRTLLVVQAQKLGHTINKASLALIAQATSKMDFPKSDNTVRVRMIDTTSVMTISSESFVEPVQPGHEVLNVTDVAFLVEHEPSGKKVMFDLGVRKDYWNLPAVIQKRLGAVIPSLKVDKDTSEILQENGIDLKLIGQCLNVDAQGVFAVSYLPIGFESSQDNLLLSMLLLRHVALA